MDSIAYLRKEYFTDEQLPIRMFHHYDQKITENHFHDFHELVIVLNGSGMHITDDRQFPIVIGDVFVVKPGVTHSYINAHNLQLENILFIPEQLDFDRDDIKNLPGFSSLLYTEPILRNKHDFKSRLCLKREQMLVVNTCIEHLNDEFRHKTAAYRFMIKAYFMQLIGFLSRCYSSLEGKIPENLLNISAMVDFIDANYSHNIKLQDIAKRGSMSISNANRCFKDSFSLSPVEYLIKVRIKNAITLLLESRYNIYEISSMCGFNDSNYFTKQFKKILGMSPRDFKRKQHSIELDIELRS